MYACMYHTYVIRTYIRMIHTYTHIYLCIHSYTDGMKEQAAGRLAGRTRVRAHTLVA